MRKPSSAFRAIVLFLAFIVAPVVVWAAVGSFTVSGSTTATVTDVIKGQVNTTGTPAAGYGAGILLRGQDASKTVGGDNLGRVQCRLVTATSGAEVTACDVQTRTGGAVLATTQTFTPTGYGFGTVAPSYPFHSQVIITGVAAIMTENLSTGTAASSNLYAKNSSSSQVTASKLSTLYASTLFGQTAANMGLFTNQNSGAAVYGNQANDLVAFISNSLTRMTIAAAGDITLADAVDIVTGTTTGTNIGGTTTAKVSFYDAAPIVQGASVADPTGGGVVDVECRAQLSALLSRIEATGLIDTTP